MVAKFEGTESYVATRDLIVAVNAAVTLARPLLIKGEPGTGKTVLAHEIASALGLRLIPWHIKSTTKAQQGLYEYDAVSRLRDSQLGDARVRDIGNYIVRGKLWDAFDSHEQVVLLMVDELPPEALRSRDPKIVVPPLHGALLKNEQDIHLFERLAFLARREGRG